MPMSPRLLRPTASGFNPRQIGGLALWLDAADSASLYTTDAGPGVTEVASPLDISGCIGWYDSLDLTAMAQNSDGTGAVAVGDQVGWWKDKSSTGANVTQGVAASRPTLTANQIGGRAALTFDGSNDNLSSASGYTAQNSLSGLTRIVVAGSANQVGWITRVWNGGGDGLQINAGFRVLVDSAGSNFTAFQVPGIATHAIPVAIYSTVYGSSAMSLRANGAAVSGSVTGTIPATTAAGSPTLHIGSNIGANQFLNGPIAEYIIYNRNLTPSELARVEAYLAAKWGIANVHAPATAASQPVGYWGDKSGNGRHATQGTAASRPTIGSQNGRRALSANGTNHEMALTNAGGVTRNAAGVTIIAALSPNTVTGIRTAVFFSIGISTGARSLLQFNGAELRAGGRRLDADSFDSATGGTLVASQPIVAVARLDYANANAVAYSNSAPLATDTSFLTAGLVSDTASQASSIMNSSGGSLFYSGIFAELLVYNRAITDAERRKAEIYLAAKWGITLYSPPAYADADVNAYITAVELADGGVALETGVRDAINDFITGCKADGIWSAIKASCILAGARTLSGALTPLVGTAPTNTNFVAGDYNRETGLKGNASNKRLDSNFGNTDASTGQNNKHAAVYATEATSASGSVFRVYIGTSGGGNDHVFFRQGSAAADLQSRLHGSASDSISGAGAATGLLGSSRSQSADYTFRHSGSNNTVTRASGAPTAGNYLVFSSSTSLATLHSDARIAFYSIGPTIDLALLDTRVSALVTAIGAAIP